VLLPASIQSRNRRALRQIRHSISRSQLAEAPLRDDGCDISDIDSGLVDRAGGLWIRDRIKPLLDFGNPSLSLRRIPYFADIHIHEIVDPPRGRFQSVTINSIVLEVHQRVARLRKTCAKSRQMFPDAGVLGTR
jgi:hypothetical protein